MSRTTTQYNNIVDSGVFPQLGQNSGSILNELNHFHVVHQLLPCLGHDWFEGVLGYDLLLVLKELVSQQWCTIAQFNYNVQRFPFNTIDSNNKPANIQLKKKKLSGTASQMWTLIRFFPFFIEIKDSDYSVWQLVLLAKSITELLTAHNITKNQISILDSLIEEYLLLRLTLFPKVKLKAKHHFLSHYPQFILKFGPAIKFWTMRFESKHRFFKQTALGSKNFKNISHTLSTKHQEFQLLFSFSSYFDIFVSSNILFPFDCNLFPALVNEFVSSQSYKMLTSNSVSFLGQVYASNMYLPMEVINGCTVVFGKICTVLIPTCQLSLAFFVEKVLCIKCNETGNFILTSVGNCACLYLNNFLDFHPLLPYVYNDASCLVLKSSFVDYY